MFIARKFLEGSFSYPVLSPVIAQTTLIPFTHPNNKQQTTPKQASSFRIATLPIHRWFEYAGDDKTWLSDKLFYRIPKAPNRSSTSFHVRSFFPYSHHFLFPTCTLLRAKKPTFHKRNARAPFFVLPASQQTNKRRHGAMGGGGGRVPNNNVLFKQQCECK